MDILKWCLIVLACAACENRQVESSAQRDARTMQNKMTPTGQALLNNKWCAFIDSTASLNPKAAMRGFLRLTFLNSDLMNIERFAEAEGKPFGKNGDDLTGLWKLEGSVLHVRTDKESVREFRLSFAEQKSIGVMKMSADNFPPALSWVCNQGVEDPMPIEIKPEVPEAPDFPTEE